MPPSFSTFGDLLKFLRRRARLTQKDLSIAVGYSESHISRLEGNERPPDPATLAALFVPALHLEKEPELVARMMELAARGESLPGVAQSPPGRDTAARTVTSPRSTPNNLPISLTSFVGRAREIAEVMHLTAHHRLVTLTGSGGCGKSRLALRVAEEGLPAYPHGVWLVEFAPLMASALIPQTIASVLGVQEARDRPISTALQEFLHPRQLLLILDNCEHLIADITSLVETLLRSCPHLKILATSRETLNVPGEITFRVPSLRLPSLGWVRSLERVAEAEAVKLFVERARASLPSFDLTEQNAAAVAQICARLDGIPLAIELAAARIRFLQVEQIAVRLHDRFNLLTDGSRNALPRHQTLRALIDWSYDLLSTPEQAFLRRLSVFAGGWTLEAAEAVAGDWRLEIGEAASNLQSPISNLDLLSQLVNKSLVWVLRQPGSEARFTMLETIREYAREKLQEAGETAEARALHFDFFYILAQRIGSNTFGPEKATWLNRAEANIDNFRTALAWSLEEPLEADPVGLLPSLTKRADRATQLLATLSDFYFYRGYTAEAREWLDRLLAVDTPPSPARAVGFQKAGFLTRISGDFEKAVALLNQAILLARDIGDTNRLAWALADSGLAARDQGDPAQAVQFFSEALSLFQTLEDSRGIGNNFYFLAETHMLNGDLEAAKPLWEAGLRLFREEGDPSLIAWGLEGSADVAFLEWQLEQATAFHQESLKRKYGVIDKYGMAHSFEGLAQVAAAQQRPERAAVLWGIAGQLRQTLNTPLDPSRRNIRTSLMPDARAQLGDDAFETAWATGQAMTLEEAVGVALGENKQ